MEDYYEYLDSNGITTLYKLIKDDTVALIDSYSVTVNGITTTLDTHINDSDIHTPISVIEGMIDTRISGLVNSAPETLDTLKELSDALGNDPNFATTIANQIGNKANSVHTHVVSDITDFPTIPTKLSQLENDMGFGTGSGGSGDTSDCVHKSGNETIAGTKTFSDKTISNKELQYKDTQYDWSDASIDTWCDAGHVSWFDKTGNRRMHELVGANGGVWRKSCFINESRYFNIDSNKNISYAGISFKFNGKDVALDENLVHKTGNETIAGNKTFSDRISFPSGYYMTTEASDNSLRIIRSGSNHGNNYKIIIQGNDGKIFAPNGFKGSLEGNADTSTKASCLDNYSNVGGNKIYLDWDTQVDNYVGLKVDKTLMGGLITTKNIGSQAANSATYATTQATTDNSTRIATTAWVRTYVNSVVGSGTVGASISAYYSTATTVTATGGTTGHPGFYPADYSDYVNIAPTVGTIYTGSQLFSSFTPTASGTINKVTQGSSSVIYQTTASAKATFSGAFSSSAKYLCTTANAVKFRAYVAQGTPTAMGSASVVDQSSSKSIFIRVQ